MTQRHHEPHPTAGWPAGLWLLAFSLLLLGGCASKGPYRSSEAPCQIDKPQPKPNGGFDWEAGTTGRPCEKSWAIAVKQPVPFSVNFVEIDEQGVLANRAQAEAAIANASAVEADASLVVVFVHGWHQNAGSTDTNVQGFYDALASAKAWNPNRQVKGIYIGWRGDSLIVPLLRYTTFWDRKDTSDEVGRGALLEFMLRLERGVKGNAANPHNRLVVIGHSFGASVTFNALAHLYLERFLDGLHSTATDTPRFHGYGDLVVLLNPAIEAMRFMPFQSALDYYTGPGSPLKADFAHETRPVLVVLSSKGDTATRVFFPAARFVSTVLESHETISASRSPDPEGKYSEWNMDRDTVGNHDKFQTHYELRLAAKAQARRERGSPSLAAGLVERCDAPDALEVRRLLNIEGNDADGEAGGLFKYSGMRVQRRPNTLTGSPYLLADVGREIISDHTDIGKANLVCWINQLLDTGDVDRRPIPSATRAPPDALLSEGPTPERE